MIYASFQGGMPRLLLLAGLAVMATACDFQYRAAVEPVEDEVLVWEVPSANSDYDHPAHISSQAMTRVLKEVRVQFKANWIQRLITGPLESVPLFEEPVLARLAPSLVQALDKAGPQERIVFYVAQRRGSDHRDVTSGALFLKGRSLTIVLANYQNRVDVVPGLRVYDRTNPEMAVAPQRFTLAFSQPEFVIQRDPNVEDGVFGAAQPKLMVDYARFLQYQSRRTAVSGR